MPHTIICGAGIAGISTAYHLAIRGVNGILLVDERPPMSLTSDKSTECYRNWWPGPDNAMVALMNHSIDLMEKYAAQSGDIFHLNRRGYLYLTADEERIPEFVRGAAEPPTLGAGPLRIHRGAPSDPAYIPAPLEGYQNLPTGADLFLNPDCIRAHFPYLPKTIRAALHVRRAGWFSAQQLGAYLLDQARRLGVQLRTARVTGVEVAANRVQAVRLNDGTTLATRCFVNAAGPLAGLVGALLDVELPLTTELHFKVAFRDPLGVLPREAPLLIWTDPQTLPWDSEERAFLAADPSTRHLLQPLPGGAHTRPEGGHDSDIMLLLWAYKPHRMEPVFPPPLDDLYPEVTLRGVSAMLPGLRQYFHRLPRPVLDGGYYTKTRENHPLIGPLPVESAYIIGALSGFGMMAACGAGDLLAAHITGEALPPYAPAFTLERYEQPGYQTLLENWPAEGEL